MEASISSIGIAEGRKFNILRIRGEILFTAYIISVIVEVGESGFYYASIGEHK